MSRDFPDEVSFLCFDEKAKVNMHGSILSYSTNTAINTILEYQPIEELTLKLQLINIIGWTMIFIIFQRKKNYP
jgi:hypothetical protein